MHYTILWSKSLTTPSLLLDLCQTGNEYAVNVEDTSVWRSVRRFSSKNYAQTEHVFYQWANELGFKIINKTNITLNDFANCD